jgi:DNA (cytosine-5)-methyltransferase 1
MTHGSLFSGIGGFDLAAEWMGWDNVFHCEWNPFGQKVLKHHFPNSISYNDITKTNFSIHEGSIDILTGGFPCQPYSNAGKQLGKSDERHLFPEMLRAIKEIKPRYIVGENVRGLVSWGGGVVFNEVCDDLEREGYAVQPILIPAASVGAPHKRDRIWFVAHSNDKGRSGEFREIQKENGKISERYNDAKLGNTNISNVANTICERGQLQAPRRYSSEQMFGGNGENRRINKWESFPTVSPICGGDDGLPKELDNITFSKWRKESIKAYGNAIVPQVAYQIFKAICNSETTKST